MGVPTQAFGKLQVSASTGEFVAHPGRGPFLCPKRVAPIESASMKHLSKRTPLASLASILLVLGAVAGCASEPQAVVAPQAEASVKPGINDNFLDPELNVDEYVERFEGESREVFANRVAIVAAMGIQSGKAVADVGAGTGPFIGLFAEAVGKSGKVYALDIAPNFVVHLAERAKQEGHAQIEARLCGENSLNLPAGSIDYAYICDVYHHFEFPRSTMASLHSALRKGGEVVIVDFEKIPGVTREWIMGHVRASKQEVIAELDSFGFDFVEELEVEGVEDNWVGRFRKR